MRPITLAIVYLSFFVSAGVQAQEKNMGPGPFSNPQLQWSRSLPPSLSLRSESQALDPKISTPPLGTESAPHTESSSYKSDASSDPLVKKWSIHTAPQKDT